MTTCQSILLHSLVLGAAISLVAGQLLTSKEHRTMGATQRANDLWCYQCDTLDDGERCVDLAGNHSSLYKKCSHDNRICMRECTIRCEPGCIVIGERTKLYACTSCCETSLCNTGKGVATPVTTPLPLTLLLAITIPILLRASLAPPPPDHVHLYTV